MADKLDEFQEIVDKLLGSLAALDLWMRSQEWHSLSSPCSLDTTVCSELLRSSEHHLSSSLSGVRTAINALAPINRLSADIMKSIFDWLSPPPLSGFLPPMRYPVWPVYGPTPQMYTYRLLCITSVCRRWRDVALSSSTLWSAIRIGPAYTPRSIVDLQLQQSGTAPVDLYCWPQRFCLEVLRPKRLNWDNIDLEPFISRLRSFHLHFDRFGAEVERLLKQIKHPAPWLEHLTVTPTSSLRPQPPRMSIRNQYSLPKIFADDMPRLRSLTISLFGLWPENHFRNLIRICLDNQMASVGESHTVVREWDRSFFFKFLSDSPRLEELVLANTYPLVDDGSTAELHLSCLKVLVLFSWDTTSIVLFLSALEIPSSCLVHLSPWSPGLDVLNVVCTHPAFNRFSRYLKHMNRLNLHSSYDASGDAAILACGQDAGFYMQTYPKLLDNRESASVPPLSGEIMKLYSAMNIQELWVDINYDHIPQTSQHHWIQLYNAMPNVSKVVMVARGTDDPTYECLKALCHRDNSPVCFPDLLELRLIFSGDITPEPLSIMQRVKADREALGFRIHKLVIGAQPPLVLYEETISDIREKLGPEVVCETLDVPFDWSPFSNREPYCLPFWPPRLYGYSPGLWSDKIYEV